MGWVLLNPVDFNGSENKQILPNEIGIGILLGQKSTVIPGTYSTTEQARTNLINLLLTTKGERIMLPEFGTDLLRLIFEPNTDQIKQLIQDTIYESTATWLPYININKLDIDTNESDPDLNHNVVIKLEWALTDSDSNLLEITSNEDGTVIAN